MAGLKNISIKTFKAFLTEQGLKKIRTTGGHEVWSGKDLLRPVIIQTHIDPIPEMVIQNNLKTIGLTKKDFINWIKS